MFPRCMLLSAILIAGIVFAGAWDTGPFDNDDALDWVWELAESDDLTVVESALHDVTQSSGYLEAPTASMAVAAAEVVAALKGKPRERLPPEVVNWVREHQQEVSLDVVQAARDAIALVVDGQSSELAQLWSESGELADAWNTELENLLNRLK